MSARLQVALRAEHGRGKRDMGEAIMESDSILAGLSVENVRVVECSMWTNPEGPAGPLDLNMNIETQGDGVFREAENGKRKARVCLRVRASYDDTDGPEVPRARYSISIFGDVLAPGFKPGEEPGAQVVRAAAVSSLYPQAQAYISMLAGLSPMGPILLPSVDPNAVASASRS